MSVRESTTFGTVLRQLRLAAGLSQEALAEQTGLSSRAISDLERDPARRPRLASVTLLADALHLDRAERASLLAAAQPRRTRDPETVSPQHLPRPLTSMFGRGKELIVLSELLRRGDHQLITLTGTGGVGKTRLALEVAGIVVDDYADGVVFVDLSPLRDPALVLPTIAQRLGIDVGGAESLPARLNAALEAKHLLLVLDNAEHLVAAGESLLGLVEATPRLVMLVTSRIALRVRGEREFHVVPLALPAEDASSDLLQCSPAGALFLERAQDIGTEIALTPATVSAIAAICRRLDGLPLAIELAVGWLPLLSPTALLARLDHRLDMLVGGARDLPLRQQALRDAITWSFDLLDEREQTLFRRLAVFSGGWTIEAAEAICGDGDARPDILHGLAALIDINLLQRQDDERAGATEMRLTMLETIREFAQEQLRGSAEEAGMRRRHYAFFQGLAAQTEAAHRDANYEEWLDRLEVEHDNLRSALEWSLTGSPEVGLVLAGDLWRFWRVRGYHSEGRRWLELLLTRAPEPSPARARALVGLGILLTDVGQRDLARRRFSEGLEIARQIDDRNGMGLALTNLGTLARWETNDDVAKPLLEDALNIFRATGQDWEMAICLRELGNVARSEGDYQLARELLAESLEISRRLDSRRALAWVLGDLALLARSEGDDDQAQKLLEESVVLYRSGNDIYDLPWAVARLADALRVLGHTARARALLTESLTRFQQSGTATGIVTVLFLGGMLAEQLDQHATAVRLLAAATEHNRTTTAIYPPAPADVDVALARASHALGEATYAQAWDEGRVLTLDQAASVMRVL